MRWWQELEDNDVLVPATSERIPLSLDDEVTRVVGPQILEWAHALACDLTREYVDSSLPELGSSPEFIDELRGSAEANFLALFLSLADPDADVQPPHEALAYVHAAVLQRIPLTTVLHGYRRGMDHWLRWCAPAISSHTDTGEQAHELQLAIAAASRYIDRLSEIMVVEYEREMQRRATSGAARRAAVVAAILAGEQVDAGDASRLLHYPLNERHIALSLHREQEAPAGVDPLESTARAVAARIGARGLLTIATGLHSMDAWVAVATEAPVATGVIEEGVTVGIGTMRTGIEGFVRSHDEAEQARAMIRVAAPGRIGPVVRFQDVQLVAMMTADLPAARQFVITSLGALADSGERARELRETLLAFLEAGKSYTAVAHTAHLHKNTVVQRVKRAAELVGTGDDFSLDVHVALMLTSVLGQRMFTAEARR